MNVLSRPMQVQVVSLLCEGTSIRAVERLTRVHRDTAMRLGVRVGEACGRLHDQRVREVFPSMIQADEAWCYIAKKQGHLVDGDDASWGDAYTYFASDTQSKLVISYVVGRRNGATTRAFCDDLRSRVLGRPVIATDGYREYIEAIAEAFGTRVHYGQVIKNFVDDQPEGERRYSPGEFVGVTKRTVFGAPDLDDLHTCHAERLNLSLRMGQRRWTRLTNAFSRKIENLAAAASLFVAHFNWCRPHMTLRCTPAMEAGLTDHVWSVDELLSAAESAANDAGDDPPPAAPIAVNGAPVGRIVSARGRTFRVIDGGAT